MKLNLNRSNGFSRMLVGTVILATLGIIFPEVVNANGAENNENLTVSAGQKQTATSVYNAGQEAMRSQNYQQAIAANPQNADDYRDRGAVYEQEGDYARAKSDWQRAASLYRQQGDIPDFYDMLQKLSQLPKTFTCRQNNGQWETVMNRNLQTYPLIVWHDQRVMDVKDGIPQFADNRILGEIPSSGEIRLNDYSNPHPYHQYIRYTSSGVQAESYSVVQPYVREAVNISNNQYDKTVGEGGRMGTISAEGRCISVSERLENLTEPIFVSGEGAENLFTLATLVKEYQGIDPKTGSYKELKNNIQVACIPQNIMTECDGANAIFTLSGEASGVNENNAQRLARFVRLIDNPGTGAPIHN